MAEIWPYLPLNDIDERLSWLTEVDQRRDDESRWGLRAARQSFELRFEFSTEGYVRADQILRGNVSGEWLVPVWTEATALAIEEGDTVLAASTEAEFYDGGKAIIWSSCDDYEIVDVVALTDGAVTIYPAAGQDRARALLMPLRVALIMDGVRVTRAARGFWNVEIEFHSQDNPDLIYPLTTMELRVALDVTTSMLEDSTYEGYSRLDIGKLLAVAILNYFEASGLTHDIQVILWTDPNNTDGSSVMTRNACDADGYDDLIAFVEAATAHDFTSFTSAFYGVETFYNSPGRRVMFLITDGDGDHGAVDAAEIRDTIDRLEVHGIMVSHEVPTGLEIVDNTGGSRVVDDGGTALFSVIVLAILELPDLGGIAFLECGGAVLSPQSGQTIRATSYLDSGLGPVQPVPTRNFVEVVRSTTLRKATRAGTWALKKLLHSVQGRHRPLYVADYSLASIAMTTTTATISEGILASADDWIGKAINIGGALREVTGASLTSFGVELEFDSVDSLPASTAVRVLRRVRLYSDDIEIKHHRRAGWATLALEMGEA